MPTIDILSHITIDRDIEAYEATLTLSTTAHQKVPCFDLALTLRNQIIDLLKTAGLADSEIHEGGSHASQSYWSRKTVTHRITIRHKTMDTLMSAMAATEKHFASLPNSMFSSTRYDFNFNTPKPIYAPATSPDEALRKAIHDAKKLATLIAQEAGYHSVHLTAAIEQPTNQPHTPLDNDADISDFTHDTDLYEAKRSSPPTPTYTPLTPTTTHTLKHFRLRFTADEKMN